MVVVVVGVAPLQIQFIDEVQQKSQWWLLGGGGTLNETH